jgi:hypothetical protein
MMRLPAYIGFGRLDATAANDCFAGDREKDGAKGDCTALTATDPVIVAPFVARNDVDAPTIWALVTVTTCVPGVAASVHLADDFPSASVVDEAGEIVPPPVAVHVSATPETDLPAGSTTCTTSNESSAADKSPD